MYGVAEESPILISLSAYAHTSVSRIFITHNSTSMKVVKVMTQSSVVSWLDSIVPNTIDDPVLSSPFLSLFESSEESIELISDRELAINAFRLMNQKKITTVGIINEDGMLIDCITAQDVKVIEKKENIQQFFSNCREFCSMKRNIKENSKENAMGSFVCSSNITVRGVLKKFVESRLHRVFVVNEDKKPVKVITLQNLLKLLTKDMKVKVPKEYPSNGEEVIKVTGIFDIDRMIFTVYAHEEQRSKKYTKAEDQKKDQKEDQKKDQKEKMNINEKQ